MMCFMQTLYMTCLHDPTLYDMMDIDAATS